MAAAVALVTANCVADSFVVDVPAGVDKNIADVVDLEALVRSTEDLVKKGGGRLVVDCSLKGFKGEIRVEEGYLLATHNEAFGDIDKGTVVSSGATLEFKHDTEALLFGKEQFTVSGTGVGGCGVLCHVGTVKDQWRAVFQRIKLAGNTRFGGTRYDSGNKYRRWDIRGDQGKLDMQGHNLEIVCRFGIASADIVNPGNITVVGADSTFCLEGTNARMGGSSANTLTIGEGARFNSQRFAPAIEWSVVLDGCICNEENYTGEYATRARINGPVTITEKGAMFNRASSASGAHWSFGGAVTVNGEIYVGSYSVDLMVVQDSGDGLDDCMAVYNVLRNASRASQLDTLLRVRLFTSGTVEEPQVYAKDFASGDKVSLDLAGAAAISLDGNQSGVFYRQLDGYVNISGADKVHAFKDLVVAGGSTLDLRDAGVVDVHTNAVNVGGKYPDIARLKIGGDTLFVTNWPNRVKGGSRTINIGLCRDLSKEEYATDSGFGNRGILEIESGSVITNLLWVGYAPNIDNQGKNAMCHGSVFMRGGSLAMVSVSGEFVNNYIASQGSGYMEVSGGSLVSKGALYPASGRNGRGLWYQKGGDTLIESSGMIFGQYSKADYPSKGVYYQTGGTVTSWGGFVFGKTLYDANNAGNRDQMTMAGGVLNIDNAIDLSGAPGSRTVVNLNGGTLKAMFMQVITNENQTIVGTGSNKIIDDTYAWVNFNGGEFKYHRANKNTTRLAYLAESFFYGNPDRLRLTSFGNGAVLDTDGYNVNLDHTITAPSGKGLVSLALPEDVVVTDWMFAGAPYIEIGGDGSGASAVAEFDSVNGCITGFTVTSPGNDYTEISARLTRGGYTNEIPLVCTLGKVSSGGLTKKGEGVLLMNAANTYEGVTRIEGGTLKALHADAIPANNGIEIAGGTLDAGGFEKAYGAISATSGTLQNAVGTFTSFEKIGDGSFMFNASLSGASPLEVKEGVLKLPVSVPGLVCGEKVYEQGAATVEYDKGMPLSNLGTDLTPSLAYKLTGEGYYQPRHYVSYSGYAWNRSSTNETWTFAYSFDDSLKVHVNGEVLTAEKCGGDGWGVLSLAKATLKPGANSILIQMWNGPETGGAISAGLVKGCINWTKDHVGIVYNPNGGDSTNGLDYVRMTDPGDGSLFTVYPYDGSTLPDISAVKMWPGTTLDVCGGNYVFTGRLQVTEEVFANPIRVLGGISFGVGATVDVGGIENLDREAGACTVLVTDSGVSGVLPKLEGAWRLRVSSDGKELELVPSRGTAIVLR